MRIRLIALLLLALPCYLGPANLAEGQQSTVSEIGRKVVRKVTPTYPAPALRMSLGGTVKVAAIVSPDGSVKEVEPLGGNPILIQAAQTAIAQWKYAPGAESREIVELHFTP